MNSRERAVRVRMRRRAQLDAFSPFFSSPLLLLLSGMVGYPESLTDPSYRGQILVLTYPLIGNYGVPSDTERDEVGLLRYMESEEVQIAGLIVSDYTEQYSHYEARQSLGSWLKKHQVPAVFGVDTRALTKKMRSEGSMLAKLICDGPLDSIPFTDPNKRNLVAEVSRKQPQTYGHGPIKIVAVDCGMKNNIVRYFVNQCHVTLKVKVRNITPWSCDLNVCPPCGDLTVPLCS